jgi:hypothetical protein
MQVEGRREFDRIVAGKEPGRAGEAKGEARRGKAENWMWSAYFGHWLAIRITTH